MVLWSFSRVCNFNAERDAVGERRAIIIAAEARQYFTRKSYNTYNISYRDPRNQISKLIVLAEISGFAAIFAENVLGFDLPGEFTEQRL